jgi:hypothetical protein
MTKHVKIGGGAPAIRKSEGAVCWVIVGAFSQHADMIDLPINDERFEGEDARYPAGSCPPSSSVTLHGLLKSVFWKNRC